MDLDWVRAMRTAPRDDLSDAVRQAAASGQIPFEGDRSLIAASYKLGGIVRKTGWAKVHKGELVVPTRAASKILGGAGNKTRKVKRATGAARLPE